MDTQKVEIDELREQVSARDTLVSQVESLNENNIMQCTQKIHLAIEEAEERQKEYNNKVSDLETQLKEWTTQFELIRSEKEEVDFKLREALQQADEHRRARTEAEARQKAL